MIMRNICVCGVVPIRFKFEASPSGARRIEPAAVALLLPSVRPQARSI